ncbi:unnamed protein product [Gongylonema pulchrum]|uniref:TPR_REGION domain-containing protein n=1 Tax=Gongylonema pulchrum TaxID=637853 RepID=A0A183E901_9BILA|nr:unnamed protein product [Gongylonema pulchrum]
MCSRGWRELSMSKRCVEVQVQLRYSRLLRKEVEDVSKRDYVYYLAIAHTRLKEYDRALAYVDILLGAESNNRQALDLKEVIKQRMRSESKIHVLFGDA